MIINHFDIVNFGNSGILIYISDKNLIKHRRKNKAITSQRHERRKKKNVITSQRHDKF